MDDSPPLKVVDQVRIQSLRERMDDAGCVFEFVVLTLDSDALIDESMHRRALSELYEQIMVGQLDWHHKLIQNLPEANYPKPRMTWDLDKAVATPLTRAEVRNLTLTEEYERGPLALYDHFREPPYLTELEGGEVAAKELFLEWLGVLGLEDRDDVVVLNWVKGLKGELLHRGEVISGREPWSDYFESGLQWWGVWCLTIWNPRLRTLSALAARTTD